MTKRITRNKFPIISRLMDELSSLSSNLTIRTKGSSICFGRIQLDKSTAQQTLAVSCIKVARFREEKFYLYSVEQRGQIDHLQKYSFKLTDEHKKTLKQYDKDSKNGSHVHEYTSGKKIKTHTPFPDSLNKVARDIVKQIECYNQL